MLYRFRDCILNNKGLELFYLFVYFKVVENWNHADSKCSYIWVEKYKQVSSLCYKMWYILQSSRISYLHVQMVLYFKEIILDFFFCFEGVSFLKTLENMTC